MKSKSVWEFSICLKPVNENWEWDPVKISGAIGTLESHGVYLPLRKHGWSSISKQGTNTHYRECLLIMWIPGSRSNPDTQSKSRQSENFENHWRESSRQDQGRNFGENKHHVVYVVLNQNFMNNWDWSFIISEYDPQRPPNLAILAILTLWNLQRL